MLQIARSNYQVRSPSEVFMRFHRSKALGIKSLGQRILLDPNYKATKPATLASPLVRLHSLSLVQYQFNDGTFTASSLRPNPFGDDVRRWKFFNFFHQPDFPRLGKRLNEQPQPRTCFNPSQHWLYSQPHHYAGIFPAMIGGESLSTPSIRLAFCELDNV